MIGVAGAAGHLGRLVIGALLDRGVPPGKIVAAAHTPEQAGELADRGVQVRHADYLVPDTLAAAFAGVDRLLLISSSDTSQRIIQHRNAVRAARAAGVGFLVYTSILRADVSRIALAVDHKATEELIRESGLPFAILRNSWYMENYTENMTPALDHGVLIGCAGGGRISAAVRADYAAAAAATLTADGHRDTIYELGGDEPFTMPELAAALTRLTGTDIVYQDLPPEEYTRALVAAGVPEPYAGTLTESDLGVSRGELFTDSGHLHRLLGRPTVTLDAAIAAALRG